MIKILQGDCIQRLRELPDNSVHCCVTSPPYWGLRAYGTEPQIWGGEFDCEHKWSDASTIDSRKNDDTAGDKQRTNEGSCGNRIIRKAQRCSKCQAWKGELGQESTPELYVRNIVLVFREVKRALREDGTCWINLGDTYFSQGGSRTSCVDTLTGQGARREAELDESRKIPNGCKPKDLCGIPWRVAFALQADGWYLRSDIIWHKPNPMPESVTDRPTKAHEYIFLLSKNQRYFYDGEAIQEPFASAEDHLSRSNLYKASGNGQTSKGRGSGHNVLGNIESGKRNKRTVWTVPSASYSEAHFATFPPDLINPCVLAGCPVGGTVLDPFAGSGTTGQVALELGRNATLIELNPEYIKLIDQRTNVTPGLALS